MPTVPCVPQLLVLLPPPGAPLPPLGVTERPAASQQRQTQGEMQKAMKDSHACRWNRWQVAAQNTG